MDFSDVNPPVHAWSTFRVFFKIDEKSMENQIFILESVFQEIIAQFYLVGKPKDKKRKECFGGGFLGLDNIGAFDRNMQFKMENI